MKNHGLYLHDLAFNREVSIYLAFFDLSILMRAIDSYDKNI